MTSTSAKRLGSNVAREARTTAVAGSDSVMALPLWTNYVPVAPRTPLSPQSPCAPHSGLRDDSGDLLFDRPTRQHQQQRQPTRSGATSSVRGGASANGRSDVARQRKIPEDQELAELSRELERTEVLRGLSMRAWALGHRIDRWLRHDQESI